MQILNQEELENEIIHEARLMFAQDSEASRPFNDGAALPRWEAIPMDIQQTYLSLAARGKGYNWPLGPAQRRAA